MLNPILTSIGIDVYAYVWTTEDTREGYKCIFNALFQEIYKSTKQQFKFFHIHGAGLETISVDMCFKQAGGQSWLGIYLSATQYMLSIC
jgi:hypothetical protein